ncbi:cytochrome p450 [Colletotrichum plurivorum]|uniref:Cytochrome p450 n=1 Tax=Colletotrichum plurivorum TaxID=2175906 RepID=A0A8H6N701_9PEZI|nr:cytochrome p450 [Colletotrichum plurivorum]
MALSSIPVPSLGPFVAAAVFSALLLRIIYNLYIHPLRKFHGPWYAASFSIVHAIISIFKREPQWMQSLVKYYGRNTRRSSGKYHFGKGARRAGSDIFQWSIGAMKRNWESRFDAHVQLFIRHMMELAERNELVRIAEKSIEVAADIMTMIAFSEPWGFIADKTDQRQILRTWRKGIFSLSFVTHYRWLRDRVSRAWWGAYFLPKPGDKIGLGYVMARIDGKPLTDDHKLAHVVLLISAGSDTVATTIGCVLRYLMKYLSVLSRVRSEIDTAERTSRLTTPIQYEEVRENLPFFMACVIPEGTEMTSIPYIVHQNPTVYAPDPEAYRPERWLEGVVGGNTKEFISEMEAANFGFGMGPRVCLGKDIAMMEIYKLVIELVRRFDFEMLDEGRFVVVGGIGLNEDLVAKLHVRVKD